jgi:lambda repressor-like predicted transcriptional regulator
VIFLEEEKKEQNSEEDVLLKLSMPGQSLRDETLQKGRDAQVKFTAHAQQTGSSISQPPQHLEPQPDEDILTKLSMPGQSLREETLQKQKTAQEKNPSSSLTPQHLEPQPDEDILTTITRPSLSSPAPEPERENPRTSIGGTVQSVDVAKVQQLAESIFNRDFSFSKKK